MGLKRGKEKQIVGHTPLSVNIQEQLPAKKSTKLFKRSTAVSSKKQSQETNDTPTNKISVKLESSPIQANVKKEPKCTKRYQRIEEVAGRAIEDILLENMQLKNRNIEAGEQILSINKKINGALESLHQLLDVEVALNPEIAVPIANEYQVNKQNKEARNELSNILVVAQALRKMRYYFHPSIEDWIEVVEESKLNMKAAQDEAKQFKEKWIQVQQEVEELREKERVRLEQEQQRTRKMEAKGVTIRVNSQPKTAIALAEQVDNQQEITEIQVVQDELEISYPSIDDYESEESLESLHLVGQEQDTERESIYVAPSYQGAKQTKQTKAITEKAPVENKKNAELQNVEQNETVVEDDLLTQIKKPKYLHLLDSHGYQYTSSPNPHFDVLIQTKEEKVPLIYIDYLIEDANSFGEIMEGTDNVYILFEKQEHLKQGNYKFTSWLFKSRERRKSVKFSLTTLADLQSRGMAELDGLQGGVS